MRSFDRDDAVLVAATEAVPAEWRDLSDLLERVAKAGTTLESHLARHDPKDRLADYLAQLLTADQIAKWQDRLDLLSKCRPDVWLVSATGAPYPENLRAVYDRPPFLFVSGTLSSDDRRALAIVGSRDASDEALTAASCVAEAAAKSGVTVVSGLARGVDAAAHRGALAAGGRTIAVVGTGIDETYPPEHAQLAAQIATQGAVVSQFRPGSPGTASSFPLRNAVISGLSVVSLLVDAGERSGTRSEAEAAIRHRRPVLLWKPVLGDRTWPTRWVAGCAGVRWVNSVNEVLDASREAEAT